MPTSIPELEAFHHFAVERISNGGARLSLADLVDLWELEHPTAGEQQDIAAALDRATAQLEAGAGRSAALVNAELRNQYGFAQR